MTNDSGKKPRDFWLHKAFEMGWTVHNEPIIAEHPLEKVIHVREVVPCENCERLEDRLYHESRKAPEVEYKLGHEIERLQAQLAMCKEALKYYRGSDDDETSWMEPDQYVPYWTLWHDGNNVGGKVASECLEKLEGEK